MVSETFEDAIKVTMELELEYLWVDAICITQQPVVNREKSLHIRQMDKIYRAADLVILATDCERATSGITGVSRRSAVSIDRTVNGIRLGISQPLYDDNQSLDSTWNWRAWTFRKRLLAKRSLVFGRRQAQWLCQCDAWCESIVTEPGAHETDSFVDRPMPTVSEPPPRRDSLQLASYDLYDQERVGSNNTLQAYQELVLEYTARTIGRAHDGLNAVQGCLNLLSAFDPLRWEKMHHGLPETFFDFAVLWQPKTICQRPTE